MFIQACSSTLCNRGIYVTTGEVEEAAGNRVERIIKLYRSSLIENRILLLKFV